MGRAKLNMELIAKEKTRLTTFKKRKQGLIRKMQEFTTLCDVSACMIIYGPNQDSGRPEPETWPAEREEVKRVIDGYRTKNKDSGSKTYGLSDFFLDRKRKIEDELAKMKKKNMEAKYPPWLPFMDGMDEACLRRFAAYLSLKAEGVRSKVEHMRRNKQGQLIAMDMGAMADYYNNASLQMHVPTNYYPVIDQHHHQQLQGNPMTMLLMNGEYNDGVINNNNNCVNYQCGPPPPTYDQRCVYYDPADPSVMWDGQPMQYYGPGVGPQPIQYGPGPELQQFFKAENHDESGDQESVNGGLCEQVNFNNNHLERFHV